MTSKILTGGITILALLGAIAFVGLSPFIRTSVIQNFGATSGNASTRHIAEFSFNPATGATTSSSLVNSDGQDRVITSFDMACSGMGNSFTALTGTGLAKLVFTAATTSTSAPAGFGNTNLVYAGNIATTSLTFFEASSTPGSTVSSQIDPARRWAAGSYITISANATNTAACIATVGYVQGLGI